MFNSQKKKIEKKNFAFFRNNRKIYRATNFGKSISMATTPWFCFIVYVLFLFEIHSLVFSL